MADISTPPEGLDDFLAEQDPQSAIAGKGLQSGAQAVYNSQPVQNVVTGQGLQNSYQNAVSAAKGDPNAQMQIAQNSLGTAMGSLKELPEGISVEKFERAPIKDMKLVGPQSVRFDPNDFKSSYIARDQDGQIVGHLGLDKNNVVKQINVDPSVQGQGIASNLYKQALDDNGIIRSSKNSSQTVAGKGLWEKLQKENPNEIKQAIDPSTGKSLDWKVWQKQNSSSFAEGGQIAAPAGLDQFLGTGQSSPQAPTSEPAGLDEFIKPEMEQAKYGTPGQQAIAGLEGAAQGFGGPLAALGEKALGVDPNDIRGRSEANPITHGLGEMAGLGVGLTTGSGEAGLATGLSHALIGEIGEGANLATSVGTAAAKGFIENAIIQSGDEVSKMINEDPNTTAQTAVANVGLAGLLGAGIGGSFGAISPLWEMSGASKLGQVAADFADRVTSHVEIPDPVNSVTNELSDLYNGIKSHASEVYGPEGLKAQDIAKVMPEMSEKIGNQASEITTKLEAGLKKLTDDPHAPILQEQMNKYVQAIDTKDPGQIFNATQELKQQLQEYSKYNKDLMPLSEKPFRNVAKDLASELRGSLEDTGVWGKAAERQQQINKAFSEYLPSLKDFESKFTSKVEGEPIIDPGKVASFVNSVGKENAAIKTQMLENFLKKSQAYQGVIGNIHSNLGIPSPIQHTPLNATMDLLGSRTAGGKLADIFIKKGLGEAGLHGAGAGVGAALGHTVGLGEVGAIIGERVLGPFFKSVLPAIAKPIMKSIANGRGLKAAAEYGAAAIDGEKLLIRGAKSVFSNTAPNVIKMPTEATLDKLDNKLKSLQQDSTALTGIGGDIGHYLPSHQGSMATLAATAVNYLNSLRPNRTPMSPLDKPPEPSQATKAQFTNALVIAQSPVSVYNKLKSGTITQQDLTTLKVIYPSLYNSMAAKINSELANAVHKNTEIPYKTRMGVSMFLGQPLDSTMTPASIQAAQMSQATPMNGQQPSNPNKTKKSTAPLSKIPQNNLSAGQAAEQDQTKR